MYVTMHCKIIVRVLCACVFTHVILVTLDHTGTLTDIIGSRPNINLVTNFCVYTLFVTRKIL